MTTASSAVSTDDEKAYGAHLPGHKGFESICTTTCPDVDEWKREHEEHGCIVTLISRDEAMAGFNEFLDAGRSTKAVAPLCHCGHTRKQHGATMQHGNDVPFDRCDYCPCTEFGLAAVATHRITREQATILLEVVRELDRQRYLKSIGKFQHTAEDYARLENYSRVTDVLMEELGEVSRAINDDEGKERVAKELIEVAAVSVSALIGLGVYPALVAAAGIEVEQEAQK